MIDERQLLNILTKDNIDNKNLVERNNIINIIKICQSLLFNNYYNYNNLQPTQLLDSLKTLLKQELIKTDIDNIDNVIDNFLLDLINIKNDLLTDIDAIYDGDPAAKSKDEVILCYPGFYAISIYRLAHSLYLQKVNLIPRIMSEYAHEKTGIDINPGATIGQYFCIDHGSGIVIGETAIIGSHVKLYQGVTIGAKSFTLDDNGNPVKSGKRHPNIQDYVIIYANATILGGDTTIGHHSIIGGNTWLLNSVEPFSKIYY